MVAVRGVGPAVGVAAGVVGAAVGLDLDDADHPPVVGEQGAQQVGRDLEGVAVVEGARQPPPAGHDPGVRRGGGRRWGSGRGSGRWREAGDDRREEVVDAVGHVGAGGDARGAAAARSVASSTSASQRRRRRG